jgi:hypothetical protein
MARQVTSGTSPQLPVEPPIKSDKASTSIDCNVPLRKGLLLRFVDEPGVERNNGSFRDSGGRQTKP